MKFNFDKPVNRRGTSCVKWDVADRAFQGTDLLPMWIADMDFATAPAIAEEMHKRVDAGVFGYGMLPAEYYEAVISWMRRRHGCEIQKDWISYTACVVTALNYAIQVVSEPRDEIMVHTPIYHPFFSAVEGQDRVLLRSPLKEQDLYYTMDFEDMERRVTEKTKAVLFCSPHNPDIKNYEQDLEKAQELIEQTGLKDKTIKVIFNSARVGQKEMAIMIQAQLQAVGLTCEVEGMETSGYFTSYFRATDTFNISLMANGMKGDPGNFCGLFNNTRSGANMYTTEEVNNLWTEIDKETDPAKRQELVNNVLAALKDCWSCVPFAQTNCVFASQPNLRGMENTNRMTDFTQLYYVE